MELRLVALFSLASFRWTTRGEPRMEPKEKAMAYLEQYGYISAKEAAIKRRFGVDLVKRAIEDFQAFAHLPMTGELNSETIEMMETPRCGVRDIQRFSRQDLRRKRFALFPGRRWNPPTLTYNIKNYTPDLSQTLVDEIIRRGFNMWEAVAGLTFSRSNRADIEILFASRTHGDRDSFDGRGGVLAHAFFPRVGDIHFDEDEEWTSETFRGNNLIQVMVHELGHSLGLDHSNVQGAIMFPFYRGYQPNFALHEDDIAGAQALYGPSISSSAVTTPRTSPTMTISTTASPTTPSPTVFSTTVTPPAAFPTTRSSAMTFPSTVFPSTTTTSITQSMPLPPICDDPFFDAITTMKGGITFIFKDQGYYTLTKENRLAETFPQEITRITRGRKMNIQAAFTTLRGNTYLLGTRRFVRINLLRGRVRRPRFIRLGFRGLGRAPLPIDAVFVRAEDENVYFFMGSKFCKYKRFSTRPICGQIANEWSELSLPLDAVWQNPDDGHIYFFKGPSFYRYDDASNQFSPPGPESTASWLGCT